MSHASIRIHDDGWRLPLPWYADDSGLWHQILTDFRATFRTHGERSYWWWPDQGHDRPQGGK